MACGSVWGQTFSFDPFGNIRKSGSISFLPNYDTATNHMSGLPNLSYDANGNLSNDSFHAYTWDADGNSTGVDTTTLTYDALDRMVEQNRSGVYTQIVYDPSGQKLALMNGQTVQKAFVPLPGGGSAVYAGTTLSYYRHMDWLGSSRFASTPGRGMYSDTAYAPYGEPYAEAGTPDRSFTGQNQDTALGLYDFLFREYHSTQGRWTSPDPAGLAAVDPANPQSWNRYAYVINNPMTLVDPAGLCFWVRHSDPEDRKYYWVQFYFCDNLLHSTPPRRITLAEWDDLHPRLKPRKPGNPTPVPNTQTCVGRARVLGGNPNTVGKVGGTGFPVARNSAAAIPSQFGFKSGRSFMAQGSFFFTSPYAGITGGKITGRAANFFFADVNLSAGGATQSFSGITDVIGSSDVPSVRNFLIERNPNALILELVNGFDQGVTTLQLSVPAGQACPAGTVDQRTVNGNLFP